MAKKTRTELSTLAINTNLPDNTTELITPTTERAQLTDERESVVNYKDDLGGTGNAGKFLTVAVDGESLTMVDEPQGDIQGSGVDGQITYWDGTKTVTSDAMLLIDTTFKTLRIVIPLANGSGGISLNAVGASASSSLVFLNNGVQMAQLYYDNATANLVLASDGDIEISPSGTLSVDSDATFDGKLSVSKSSTDFIAEFQNTNGTNPYGVRVKDATSPANNYPLFSVANSGGTAEYFRVNSGTGVVNANNGIQFGTGAILDAYEEGTWTPVSVGTSNITSLIFTNGTFIKIGNQMIASASCSFSITNTTTQTFFVVNYPITAATNNTVTTGGIFCQANTSPYPPIPSGVGDGSPLDNTRGIIQIKPVYTGSHVANFSFIYRTS